MTQTETTRRRHAIKRSFEGGGGWTRERKPGGISRQDATRKASATRKGAN